MCMCVVYDFLLVYNSTYCTIGETEALLVSLGYISLPLICLAITWMSLSTSYITL